MTTPTDEPAPQPSILYSPDGKHWWDGQGWQPVPADQQPARPSTNRTVIGVVALVILAAILAAIIGSRLMNRPDQRLADAHETCEAGTLGDNDQSLTLNMEGEDANSGTDTYESVFCTLGAVDIPDSTWRKMEETTAMQGRQSDEWDGIEASWTYHPDQGLDIVLEVTER